MSRAREIIGRVLHREPVLPVEAVIPISGLRPGHSVSKTILAFAGGKPVQTKEVAFVSDNLEDKMSEVVGAVDERPWVSHLMEEVVRGKKSAIFVVALGTIGIFAATAGFEFGLRGGRDIVELYDKIQEWRQKNNQSEHQR